MDKLTAKKAITGSIQRTIYQYRGSPGNLAKALVKGLVADLNTPAYIAALHAPRSLKPKNQPSPREGGPRATWTSQDAGAATLNGWYLDAKNVIRRWPGSAKCPSDREAQAFVRAYSNEPECAKALLLVAHPESNDGKAAK